jgi:hypothetical protein
LEKSRVLVGFLWDGRMHRIAQDFAARLVAAVIENY